MTPAERRRRMRRATSRRPTPARLFALACRRRRRRPEPYRRADVLVRWGGCCYCDGPAEELDHVVPLAHGGPDIASNVVASCRDCNARKYTKTLADWASEP
ncbi:HNH endonuclease signature motif containing protein [Streptomyces sp. NPDC050095]|uniref:HNH endonuclease n=1 Tax=unclassified Streptomyces TaxID=2593676 RepID=UPI0034287FE9